MEKKLFLFLFIGLNLSVFSQTGSIFSYWPTSPMTGDTIYIEYDSSFPLFSSNGPTCGVHTGYSDTTIGTRAEITTFMDMCYTTSSPTGCFRTDTAQFVYTPNIDTIMLIWNYRGTICVTVPARNTDTAYIYFNTTSIDEIIGKKLFSFHPNPVKESSQLDYPKGLTIQQIQLWNMNGQQMPSPILEGNKLNLERYNSGVYFLRIESNKGTEVLKVVKQ